MKTQYLIFKFWEKMYFLSPFVFGNMPVTYELKHKMNMAWVKYQIDMSKK